MRAAKQRLTGADALFSLVIGVVMVFVLICTVYPFIYMTAMSFSSGAIYGKIIFFPVQPTLVAYDMMIRKVRFLDALPVSVARATLGPFLTLVVTFMAGYALSRSELIGRRWISRFMVFSMYFSAGLLPAYLNMRDLRLGGTFWVYIMPSLVSVYHMILIRTFVEQLPRALEESAVIDGANDLVTAFRIVLPLCLPVLAAVALFQFVSQWNAYMDTEIYNAHVPSLYTLQYSLSIYLRQALNFTEADFNSEAFLKAYNAESLKMAMTVVVCIPIFIVYPFLQKYFIKGILIGSVKG